MAYWDNDIEQGRSRRYEQPSNLFDLRSQLDRRKGFSNSREPSGSYEVTQSKLNYYERPNRDRFGSSTNQNTGYSKYELQQQIPKKSLSDLFDLPSGVEFHQSKINHENDQLQDELNREQNMSFKNKFCSDNEDLRSYSSQYDNESKMSKGYQLESRHERDLKDGNFQHERVDSRNERHLSDSQFHEDTFELRRVRYIDDSNFSRDSLEIKQERPLDNYNCHQDLFESRHESSLNDSNFYQVTSGSRNERALNDYFIQEDRIELRHKKPLNDLDFVEDRFESKRIRLSEGFPPYEENFESRYERPLSDSRYDQFRFESRQERHFSDHNNMEAKGYRRNSRQGGAQSRNSGKQNEQNERRGKNDKFPEEFRQGSSVFNSNLQRNFKETPGSFVKQEYQSEIEHFVEERNQIENEEFGSDEESPDTYKKSTLVIPDASLVKKFELYPPTAEEMGKILKEMVIYFFYKRKNVMENNPFVIICESFRRSDRFGNLEVEDGFQPGNKSRKFCTLRWNGIMMVRAMGENGNLKEPRVRAGVNLINELATTCYSLKMKNDYYSKDAFEKLLAIKEVPGVFRLVEDHEIPTLNAAQKYITEFYKKDTDCELCFSKYIMELKWFAKKSGLDVRTPNNKYMVVFNIRSPQYWKDKILASGKMENEKFILIPPTDNRKKLLECNILRLVPGLKKLPRMDHSVTEIQLYGPKGQIPEIKKACAPWERRGGNRRTNRVGRGRGFQKRRK